MTADDDKTGGFGLTGPAYSRLEALGIARMRMHQRELDALRALLSAAREAEAALASMTIDRDSWAEQADQRAAEAAEYLTRTQKAEAALAEEREARERAERELAAAVEFHLHALDATYRCLPLGKPDTEPDRWVAIAHRMTKLEAALLLIRDGEGDAQDIAWNALESALRAAPAQPQPLGPIDLAALPVHFVSLLPRGHIFMHPDTPRSGVRDPWPPPMPSVTFQLDGDGRDGFNGDGPFEG